jgi:hypothetical protein
MYFSARNQFRSKQSKQCVFLRMCWALLIAASFTTCTQPPPAPQPQPYTLTGNVEIINDCDGKLASIPDSVVVKASVGDAKGNTAGGQVTINVAAPAGATNPRKTGNYTLTVNWIDHGGGPGQTGPATTWSDFSVTRVDGTEICKPIACTAPSMCTDIAQKDRSIPIAPRGNTTEDIRVSCSCTH